MLIWRHKTTSVTKGNKDIGDLHVWIFLQSRGTEIFFISELRAFFSRYGKLDPLSIMSGTRLTSLICFLLAVKICAVLGEQGGAHGWVKSTVAWHSHLTLSHLLQVLLQSPRNLQTCPRPHAGVSNAFKRLRISPPDDNIYHKIELVRFKIQCEWDGKYVNLKMKT